MKQAFCLSIAVVFLFGFAVVHGSVSPGLQSIDCSDASSISFSIYIPDIAEWEGSTDASTWTLNEVDDEACEPTFDQFSKLVTYTDIDVNTCHPQGDPAVTPDRFEYEFVISVKAEAGSAIAPVTFAYDHDYVVKCFYNREQENIMASFQPLHSLSDAGSAVGTDFVIEFTVHTLDGNEVTSATVIDLSTEVYGKIEITDQSGIPQNLDVHLVEVTADNDNVDGGEVTLVENGCPESAVVSNTDCGTDTDERFFFRIFRFPGQIAPNLVYLKARVIVCLSDNLLSICQAECPCSNGRKRRNTLEQVQQTEFYVTAGPLIIREPDQESEAAAGKDEGTPLPAYVIAVVAVCGLLAVAIVSAVVLIVFRRRRQNVANVELKNEDSVTA